MMGSDVDGAWAEVTARWEDEAAHRAFLEAWGGDLDGLAEVGRRYRGVLDTQPDEPVAQRWRDEVVKRATVIAMAQFPRTRPPPHMAKGLRRAILVGILVVTSSAVAWLLMRVASLGGGP